MGQTNVKNLGNGGTMDGDVTITGDLTVSGGIGLTLSEVIEGTSTIDVTDTEAFLVRKNSDGGDVFIVDSTNTRVGVGKTPTSLVHIYADDNTKYQTVIEQDSASTGDAALKFDLTGVRAWLVGLDNSDSDKFKISMDANDLNDGNAITIDQSLNIGLGTSSPADILHLVSASDGGSTEVILDNSAAGDSTDELVGFRFRHNGGTAARILVGRDENFANAAARSGFISFRTSKDDTETEKMKIGSDGTVTITQASASKALYIDQNANQKGIHVDTVTTTEEGIAIDANSLTTGKGLYVYSNSSSTGTRNLTEIHNDHASATGATVLKIQQDAAQVGLSIDHNANERAINIDAENTSERALNIECDAITSGSIAKFYSAAGNTTARNLVYIHNDDASATGAVGLKIQQDSTGAALVATGHVKVDISGMTESVIIGQNLGSTTYGLISFNGSVTDSGKLGFTGGGGTDKNLYYDVPTGGSHIFRENATNTGLTIDASQNVIIQATKTLWLDGGGDTGVRETSANNMLFVAAGTTYLNLDGANSKVVFNDDGSNIDFIVEGDNDANLLYVDAGNDNVGIGTGSPASDSKLHLYSATHGADLVMKFNAENNAGTAIPFYLRLDPDADTFALFGDVDNSLVIHAGTGNVGIGIASPTSGANWSQFLQINHTTNSALVLTETDSTQSCDVATNGAGMFIDVAGHADATNNAINFRTEDTNSNYTPTTRMTITSAGNVQINGAGNYSQLQIISTGAESGIKFVDSGGTVDGYIYATASTMGFLNSSGAYTFKVDSNSRISLSNNDAGTDNTVFGFMAGAAIESGGVENTLIGDYAGTAITTGDYNTAVGKNALPSEDVGQSSTAIGYSALGSQNTVNQSHVNNVGVGVNTGYYNGTGTDNTWLGANAGVGASGQSNSFNTGVGSDALLSITTGTYNVAVGSRCGDAITTGHQNTFLGDFAGSTTTNVGFATAVGHGAMGSAIVTDDADGSVAIGATALESLTNATGSVAIGFESLKTLSTGNFCTAIGHQAGALVTGSLNTIVGYQAADLLASGTSNTIVGARAFGAADGSETNSTIIGTDAGNAINHNDTDGNVIIGNDAGTGGGAALISCVAIGYNAMNSTGGNAQTGTVSIGKNSLTDLTSGGSNTAVGYLAADSVTTGSNNTVLGYEALPDNVVGSANTAIGRRALYEFVADTDNHGWNTAVGQGAGYDVTTGTVNTLIGNDAGNTGTNDLTTGDANTLLGSETAVSTASASNQTVIGYTATGQANNSVTLGNADVTAVYMASDKGATLYCDKIAVGAGITQHSTTHLDVQGSIRAGCGNAANGSTQSGHLMGITGATEGDNTVNLLKASMSTEGSLWVISGQQHGTSNRFTDLVLYYSTGVAVVSAQNTGSPDSRTYSVSSEKLFLLINVTDGGEQTYNMKMTGIGANELSGDAAPTIGGTG